MKTVAIAQARMGSTRAPGKVMRDLCGKPVLKWTVNALEAAIGIDKVVVATSTQLADVEIAKYCEYNGILVYRGSESNVLQRFYECAKLHKADIILRLTCDCPFLDPTVISEVVRLRKTTGAAYASNTNPPTYPDGLDVECFTFAALQEAYSNATRSSDLDCVTQYIIRNRHTFPAVNLTCPIPGLVKERWVLDTEDDFAFCVALANILSGSGKDRPPSYTEILEILDKIPALRKINPGDRNERFYEALAREKLPRRTFTRSNDLFKKAIQSIPFGAQTFSKSYLQFPLGQSPLFLSHGDGARVFDVDGNDYVDLVNALLPVVLGYRDHDVDAAIRNQLDSGISFSLATELEEKLASKLCEIIPCAQMVKFGKSGTDVTTAAVRLARAYTGRDHVVYSGYHGWADWSLSRSDYNLGIPEAVRSLSHKVKHGDADWMDNFPVPSHEIAAIVVEPDIDAGYRYLQELRNFCDKHGIVLIFDEIITGFRYDIGGGQKMHKVTPDLATFGKSMANGMPISALVGKRDIMKRMQPPDNIFYSGTFFGETLSIAAALATIKKMEDEPVIDHLRNIGDSIYEGMMIHLDRHDLYDYIQPIGHPSRRVLKFEGPFKEQVQSTLISEMAQNGVLIINANNISYAHKRPEMFRILDAYDASLSEISKKIKDGSIKDVPVKSQIPPLRAA